jgi:hypothetical protein
MKQFIALAALPFMVAPAMAAPIVGAPYVETKTTAAASDGDYKGAQTELRVGYEALVQKGVLLYAEVGPGYEWTAKKDGEVVTVGEVGVKAKVSKNVGVQAKLGGEYGGTSKVFDLGGELKVRYTF